MSKIVQQIQTRFKFFQIFWLISLIFSFGVIIASEFFVSFQSAQVTSPVLQMETNIGLIFGFLGLMLIFIITSAIATITYSMLTHGIYNYLKLSRGSDVNPTWAVWSIFIPLASYILVAINAKKGYESLKISSETAQYNFYTSIFYTIIGTILSFASIFYSIYQSIQSNGVPIVTKPFLNVPFYISIASLTIGMVVVYFTWKIMKEMTGAIVAENSEVAIPNFIEN